MLEEVPEKGKFQLRCSRATTTALCSQQRAEETQRGHNTKPLVKHKHKQAVIENERESTKQTLWILVKFASSVAVECRLVE